jgi:hypothetical protein
MTRWQKRQNYGRGQHRGNASDFSNFREATGSILCPSICSRNRLKRHPLIRHLVYSVRYRPSVVQMNSSHLTVTLYSSVITTQNIQSLSWRYNCVPPYITNRRLKGGISLSYYEYYIYFELTYTIILSSQFLLTPADGTFSLNNPLTAGS